MGIKYFQIVRIINKYPSDAQRSMDPEIVLVEDLPNNQSENNEEPIPETQQYQNEQIINLAHMRGNF